MQAGRQEAAGRHQQPHAGQEQQELLGEPEAIVGASRRFPRFVLVASALLVAGTATAGWVARRNTHRLAVLSLHGAASAAAAAVAAAVASVAASAARRHFSKRMQQQCRRVVWVGEG
jgi:hypothetical protein